ncbi:MAG: GLUG motif-containing protein [Lachnospiraceae bacterium]
MIKTVSGALEDLNFENMKFSAVDGAKKYGGENVGLIGELNGSASNLSFDKVTVDAPAANQVGCIGSAMGDVKDVKLKDISVNGKDYTGGLIGILMKGGSIENVTAEGTANPEKNYAYFKQLEQKKAEDPKGNANLVTKPMQTDYSYVVTGANHCGGIAGQARGMVSKIEIRGAYVGNGKDYSGSQHGGIVGSSYSYNTDFLIGDPKDQTIPVRVSGLNDTAGGVGYVHWSATKVERANGYHLYVDGNTNIAGLVGQDTVAYHCRLYKSTVSGTTRVSGIMAFGSGTMSRYSEVRECEIYGSTRVSGISAEGGASYSALINSTVTGSSRYIGGIVGYDRGSINYCTVTGSKIIGSTANSEKATVVGGLIGFGNAEKSYVADTVVSGYSIVGGAVGWTIGNCNNISVEADVSAAEGYVGGFTGILTSYSWKSIEQYYSERFPYVQDVTVGGTVHVPTYAGGFAGIVETYPPEYDNMTGDILQQGSDGLDGDHFYNIQLMLKEINCDSGMTDYRNKTTMWGYFTQDRLSLDGKISYTPDERINSHQIDGITPTASRKSRSSVWVGTTSMDSNGKPIELISDSGKAGYVTWTKHLGTSWDLAWTTTADLKTEDFWKNSGPTTKDAITQALKLAQVPWRNSIDSISGDKITWVVNYSTDAIPTDGWWNEVSSNTWNAADYMNGTASKTYGYSNGTTGESYDDVFKAPGIFEIPVSDKTISTFSLDEMGDDLVTCYASGAGLLNLELADGLYGVHISVADSS